MAAVDYVWATAANGDVTFTLTYDSVTGAVSTVTIVNNTPDPVLFAVGNRSVTFQPGTTTQDVSAFSWNVTKAANFFPRTQVPAG